jgi:hypothetical protein
MKISLINMILDKLYHQKRLNEFECQYGLGEFGLVFVGLNTCEAFEDCFWGI